jgi:putative copper export protein
VATLAPAFTGHAADEDSRNLAVAGVALHVVGVVLWAGALQAIMLARRFSPEARRNAAERVGRPALPRALIVAVSGVITAAVLSQLVETSYGLVVLVKIAALVALVAMG